MMSVKYQYLTRSLNDMILVDVFLVEAIRCMAKLLLHSTLCRLNPGNRTFSMYGDSVELLSPVRPSRAAAQSAPKSLRDNTDSRAVSTDTFIIILLVWGR